MLSYLFKGPRGLKKEEVNKTGGAYSGKTKTIAEQVNMHHLALGSPTQATFLRAVEKGWLTGFPSLTVENTKQLCTKKAQTILGHQKLIRQNIRSTKTPTPVEPELETLPIDPTPRTIATE